VFDLSPGKILVLAILAVVVFGPDQLPRVAAQAGRVLRELRRMADTAKADLQEGLGPEFSEFDLTDLDPRRFVQKHLMDTVEPVKASLVGAVQAASPALPPGESPPFDAEAT
jgi:sec-independent protein translocase protein TatB